MDKRLIHAVAGAGKTSYLINQISTESSFLFITYTNNNVDSIKDKIKLKYGNIPNNITVQSYHSFLLSFCYMPYFKNIFSTSQITFNAKPFKYARKQSKDYYISIGKELYASRLALLCQFRMEAIQQRIAKYYDYVFIDEVQDFASHDFDFLLALLESDCNFLLVGDYCQHTFPTSVDGNKHKNLYNQDLEQYFRFFKNIEVDRVSLLHSYRCSKNISEFIEKMFEFPFKSHRTDNTAIHVVTELEELKNIFQSDSILKLFYSKASHHDIYSENWGNSKGNEYQHTCVILTKEAFKMLNANETFALLSPTTKNKLYVACSRTKGDLFFCSADLVKKICL